MQAWSRFTSHHTTPPFPCSWVGQLLVTPTQVVEEIPEVFENIPQERISENIPGPIVDPRVPQVELAESSGEAGSSWSRVNVTTSTAATATVAKSVGEAPPLRFAKCSATTESELAECEDRPPRIAKYSALITSKLAVSSDEESSDGTGPPWSGASGTSSTAATATVAKHVEVPRDAGLAAARHETFQPNDEAMWNQCKAKFQKVYSDVDVEVVCF